MNFSKTTDEYGQAVFTLPQGDYRFRADAGGTQYWSSEENDCTLPGCTATTVITSKPVMVSVVNSLGTPQAGLSADEFVDTTYSNYSEPTITNKNTRFEAGVFMSGRRDSNSRMSAWIPGMFGILF